ncbi:hypothetical protein D3C81_582730 [compost metagenome]
MRLAGNSRSYGSGIGLSQAASRVIRGFICRSGVAIILTISGCAGRTEPQVQYVRVEVPVQVPCRALNVEVPSWAAAGLKKGDDVELKVRALLAERRQRIGYERQLVSAVTACH